MKYEVKVFDEFDCVWTIPCNQFNAAIKEYASWIRLYKDKGESADIALYGKMGELIMTDTVNPKRVIEG